MSVGGFEVKIASVNGYQESFRCPHCEKLLREAVQTKSGDRLCESCFKSIARYVFVGATSVNLNLT